VFLTGKQESNDVIESKDVTVSAGTNKKANSL